MMRYVASGLCFFVVIKNSFVFLCHRLKQMRTTKDMQLYQADSTSCVNYLMLLSLQVISRHVELQGKSPPLEQQEQV